MSEIQRESSYYRRLEGDPMYDDAPAVVAPVCVFFHKTTPQTSNNWAIWRRKSFIFSLPSVIPFIYDPFLKPRINSTRRQTSYGTLYDEIVMLTVCLYFESCSVVIHTWGGWKRSFSNTDGRYKICYRVKLIRESFRVAIKKDIFHWMNSDISWRLPMRNIIIKRLRLVTCTFHWSQWKPSAEKHRWLATKQRLKDVAGLKLFSLNVRDKKRYYSITSPQWVIERKFTAKSSRLRRRKLFIQLNRKFQ